MQSTPWNGDENAPWVHSDGTIDEELRDAYQADIRRILEPSRHSDRDRPRVYNLPVNHNVQISDIMNFVRSIQQSENSVFRINLEFGYILRDRITGRHRYYSPISSNGVLNRPFRIDRASDVEKLEKILQKMDIIQHTLKKRPNTRWELALLTNLQATVYPMDFVAGAFVTLPTFIKNSKSIKSLDVSKEGVPYTDQLCAFRCLAHFLNTPAETEVKKLWRQYLSHKKIKETDFKGMPLADMPIFEDCFSINTTIYSLFEDGTVEAIYKSSMRHERTMYLNLYDTHLSLITRIAPYSRKFKCTYCGHLWKTSSNLLVHQRLCQSKTKYRFPGGHYTPYSSIFDEIESFGITVPKNQRFYPYYIGWDFEAMVKQTESEMHRVAEHIPVSVAIGSNVPGFEETKCIINPNGDELVKEMEELMTEIAKQAEILLRRKWRGTLTQLDNLISYWRNQDDPDMEEMEYAENEWMDGINSDSEGVENNEEAENNENCITSHFMPESREDISDEMRLRLLRKLVSTKIRFEQYIKQVPNLGYNSSKYDLNLVMRYFVRHFRLTDKNARIIKRSNAYACISTERFRFLDVLQYLPQGTSYAQFLKAFAIQERKSFWPYEYLDCESKLEETELPPLGDAWYSSLKQKSVLDDGEKSIEENYANLQRVWREHNMKTMRDMLRYYNSLDVGPLLQGIEKIRKYYQDKAICVFKSSISVPGCARQLLFRSGQEAGGSFPLFDEKNKDLFGLFKENIVGGPCKSF